MNNQAKAILWIGLILIAVQLIQQWQTIKSIIFTPSTPLGGAGLPIPSIGGFSVGGLGIPGMPVPKPVRASSGSGVKLV